MTYTLWIPLTIGFYALYAYLSVQNNTSGGIYFWLLMMPVPLWAVISKKSADLVFDGLLFNFFMIISETIAMVFFVGDKLTLVQYFGIIGAVICLMMMRIG